MDGVRRRNTTLPVANGGTHEQYLDVARGCIACLLQDACANSAVSPTPRNITVVMQVPAVISVVWKKRGSSSITHNFASTFVATICLLDIVLSPSSFVPTHRDS